MGIPLQQAILGDEGVFYCAAYVIMHNIYMWSYGVVCMSGDKRDLSVKKLTLNPGTISVAIGLVLFIFSIPVPTLVTDAIGHMGELNTSLPMLIVGYYIAQTDILGALKDGKSYLCILLRLVAMPLVALGAMLLVGLRGNVLVSCMICACAPVATATTMFATRYDRNPLLSVNLVSLSTILSVITMPILIAITQLFG